MKTDMTLEFSREGDDSSYEVDVEYYGGAPATGPSYDCGGTPEEPPAIAVRSVWRVVKGIRLLVDDIVLTDNEIEDLTRHATEEMRGAMEAAGEDEDDWRHDA